MWWLLLANASAQPLKFEAGERLQPTDEVLAALGLWDESGTYEDKSWGAEVHARLATDLECGALNIDVDAHAVADSIADIPKQLVTTGQTLTEAIPMLGLCALSPSLCAELKNLNLRIDQEIDFQAGMCRAIEGFIDQQADEGERIRLEAAQAARAQCIQDNGNTAEAMRICGDEPQSGLVTDIVDGFLTEKVATQPQRLLSAAVDATNHELAKQPGLKGLLSAVAGEAELTVNGEVIPLLDEGSLTSEDIVDSLLYWAGRYSCSLQHLERFVTDEDNPFVAHLDLQPTASTEYALHVLEETLDDELTRTDLDNMRGLSWGTYRSFCTGLRNTAARETARTMHNQVSALVDKALENPQLPGLGKSKLKQARRTTQVVFDVLEGNDQILSFGEWQAALADAAASAEWHNRALSEALREGEKSQRELWEQAPPCNTYLECKEGP